MNFFPSAEVSC